MRNSIRKYGNALPYIGMRRGGAPPIQISYLVMLKHRRGGPPPIQISYLVMLKHRRGPPPRLSI